MNAYEEQPLHAAHPRVPAHLRERNLIEIVLNLVLSLGSSYMLYSALFGCPHMEILALMVAVFDGMIVFPICTLLFPLLLLHARLNAAQGKVKCERLTPQSWQWVWEPCVSLRYLARSLASAWA
jgi:hypothetical protein